MSESEQRRRLENQLRASLMSDPNRTVAVLAAALGDYKQPRKLTIEGGTDSEWLDRRIEEIAARGR